jgi:hypothetical protein
MPDEAERRRRQHNLIVPASNSSCCLVWTRQRVGSHPPHRLNCIWLLDEAEKTGAEFPFSPDSISLPTFLVFILILHQPSLSFFPMERGKQWVELDFFFPLLITLPAPSFFRVNPHACTSITAYNSLNIPYVLNPKRRKGRWWWRSCQKNALAKMKNLNHEWHKLGCFSDV